MIKIVPGHVHVPVGKINLLLFFFLERVWDNKHGLLVLYNYCKSSVALLVLWEALFSLRHERGKAGAQASHNLYQFQSKTFAALPNVR